MKINKAVVFGSSRCGYTQAAIEKLPLRGTTVVYFENKENGEQMKQHLQQETGQWTQPFIYVNSEFIGGYEALVTLLNKKAKK